MNQKLIEIEALEIITAASDEMLSPHPGECLVCFVGRQLDEFGCTGTHRFAMHYRNLMAPRATALYERLANMGACCCDCEMFMNAYEIAPHTWQPYRTWVEDGFILQEDAKPLQQSPPCAGVRKGSTQPCSNWQRQYRRRRYR